MPTATAAVPDGPAANAAADAAEFDLAEPRRKPAARRRGREAAPGDDDADTAPAETDDGFGSGLAEEAPKQPARKTARKKTAKTAAAKAGEEAAAKRSTRRKPAAEKKPAGRKAPAAKKKAAPKRTTRRKKAAAEELDLSEFDFGNDDGPRVPINPSAAAAVKPRRSVTGGDDFGVRLPPSVAKSLAVEQLAQTLDDSSAGRGKKARRGRRGKKDRDAAEPQPSARRTEKPAPNRGGGEPAVGVLEMHPKGYGFLRDAANNYVAQESDPFVSGALIDRFRLREGVRIEGEIGPGNRGQGPRNIGALDPAQLFHISQKFVIARPGRDSARDDQGRRVEEQFQSAQQTRQVFLRLEVAQEKQKTRRQGVFAPHIFNFGPRNRLEKARLDAQGNHPNIGAWGAAPYFGLAARRRHQNARGALQALRHQGAIVQPVGARRKMRAIERDQILGGQNRRDGRKQGRNVVPGVQQVGVLAPQKPRKFELLPRDPPQFLRAVKRQTPPLPMRVRNQIGRRIGGHTDQILVGLVERAQRGKGVEKRVLNAAHFAVERGRVEDDFHLSMVEP